MAQNIFGFDREPKTLSSQDSWGHGRERRRCCWIWTRERFAVDKTICPIMTIAATRMTKKLALRWKQIRHLGTASTQILTLTSTLSNHFCRILLPKTAQGEQQQEKIMKTILKVTGTVNSCRLKDHKKQQQVENNVNYLGTVNSCRQKHQQ